VQPLGARDNLPFLCPFSFRLFSLSPFFCKGGSHPETCAQRAAEGEGFPCVVAHGRGPEASFPFVFLRPHIPWGWVALSRELNNK
jgi:hypothetical protein